MNIPDFSISSKDDVNGFVAWLIEHDILLHPDDSFTWIADIPKQQAEYLDGVMEKCFEICGDSIYELINNQINNYERNR